MTSQPDNVPKPKRLERSSDARRSVDLMVRHALQSGTASSVGDLLDRVAEVSGRRLFNALLAVLQLPEATLLHTASDWEHKWRRTIKAGERPLVLLFPFGPVEFVFDVSQTEVTERSRPIDEIWLDGMQGQQTVLSGLFRMLSLAANLGVDVAAGRRGASASAEIRPVGAARTLLRPWPAGQSSSGPIPARWLLEIDRSDGHADQLGVLALHLGHLFCGHLGAIEDDPWPNREDRRHDVGDVEAEAVARLLFRRLAPLSRTPAILERHTSVADFMPAVGWTYITQAADKMFEMAQCVEVPPESEMHRRLMTPWASDLVIQQGGSDSEEVVLVRATKDSAGLPERVGDAWAATTSGAGKPWLAVAHSEAAFKGVLSYFDQPPGDDPGHDQLARLIEALVPVGTHWLTVVEAGQGDQDALVELQGDPPAHHGDMVSASVDEIRKRGVECSVPPLDESWMYTTIECGTGDVVREQVLGWDDMYSDEQWRFLSNAGRVFVSIRPDAGLHEPHIVELLAEAIASARRQVQAYYCGDFEHLDDLDESEGVLLVE